VICTGAAGRGVVGRDPRTGRPIWHAVGWEWARPIGGGRLLTEGRQAGRSSLLDQETGRLIADLGPGVVVLDERSGQVLTISSIRSAPFGFKLSELDEDGRMKVRGRLGVVLDYGCQVAAERLACAAPAAQLTVRALR
jgi:hypothetical protein